MFLRSFKEINRFVSKWVWNIYLNISYWAKLTFSKLRFFKFKIFVFSSVFGAFQLTQISLNFYSWFNLKSTFFLLNIKANFNKKNGIGNGKSYTWFQRNDPCASPHTRIAESNTMMSWSSQKKECTFSKIILP